jgi:23S rRNA (cytidine1920-2'-O)/16S rRNA (cytidine1409-2'-O)-methyltransferase
VRKRLDVILVERGLAETREKARRLIMAGMVREGERRLDKPGTMVPEEAGLVVEARSPYVSRGGEKLAGALAAFGLDPGGMEALDVGASTGGFTDCLLQHGARRVHAVDVGRGQLDRRLRLDHRVVVREGVNIRHLPPGTVPPVDLAVIDASFISLRLVLPAVLPLVRPGGIILALVKPQFELGKGEVGKGVVRDEGKRQRAVAEVSRAAADLGLLVKGSVASPLAGARGNVEYFLLLGVPASGGGPDVAGGGPDGV